MKARDEYLAVCELQIGKAYELDARNIKYGNNSYNKNESNTKNILFYSPIRSMAFIIAFKQIFLLFPF